MKFHYCFELIIKAAIAPGTHPQHVNKKVINTDPQPLSITDNGGNKMHNIALISPM